MFRKTIMATTPTEVLNEDIKELKLDLRENRNKIDLVKEEVQRLAVSQGLMRVELVDEIHKVAISQAEMKGEFRLVKMLLAFVLAGLGGSLWQFFSLNAKVNGVETKIERVETKIDQIEASIAKILEQTKPAPGLQVR